MSNDVTAAESPVAVDASPLARVVDLLERHWFRLAVVLGCLATLGAVVVVLRSGSEVSFYDEGDFFALATHLADGDGFTLDGLAPTAYRAPGLPLLLGVVALFDRDLEVLRLFNALLLGPAIVVGAMLARRLAGPLTAAVAAAGLSTAPVAVYTATKLYPQTLATLLMVLSLTAVVMVERSSGRSRWWWAAGAGLSLGWLTLTVPNHGVTLVVAGIWLAWRLRREALAALAIVAVLAALPLGAWTVRNYAAFDSFVSISSNGGVNLLLGNTDGTGAGTGTNVDILDLVGEADRAGLDEIERDEFFRDAAIDWITEDPVRAGRLYAAKLLNTFSVEQELATEDQQPSRMATVLLAVTYLPVLALFLVRPLLRRRVPLHTGEGLLIAVFWTNVLATAVAFTRIRFRVPIDPLMVIVAAVLVASWLERLANRRVPSSG